MTRTIGSDRLHLDKPEPKASEILGREVMPHVYFKDMRLSVERRSPDAFIFCTSYRFTDPLLRRWCVEEKADACYEISDPVGFFRAISNEIRTSALFKGCANVDYVDDELDYLSKSAQESPAITKNGKLYGWQYENRAIWSVREPCGSLKPWIVSVPDAIQYCRNFANLEDGKIST